MTPLPYERATSGKSAIEQMRKVLTAFGARSFGVMEDFQTGDVIVQFECSGRRVTVRASVKGYANAWLKRHPHNWRMRHSPDEHRRRALVQGSIAVNSILRDWIKGQVTAIETGLLSFDAAFLAQITLTNGETVLERVTRSDVLQLPSA